MYQQLKSLTRDSIVYGVGHIAARLVTFLLLPFYSFHLSPAEYGEVTLYFLFIAVTQTFYIYGLDIAFLRYFTLAKQGEERRQVAGTALLTSLATTSALTLAIILGAEPLGRLLIRQPVHPEIVTSMIRWCSVILLFDTLSTFPFLQLRGDLRPYQFTATKLANVGVNLGLNIWFLGALDLSVKGILWANTIASGFTLLILLPMIWRGIVLRLDRHLLAEMLRFGLPNIPTYLFVMVIELADRKILELFRGLEEAGLYSAGYKLGMFMAVVTGAFRFAWQPFFLSHAEEEHAPQLFARVLTYYLLVTGTLFLVLTFFIEAIVQTRWPGVGYLIDVRYWPGLAVFPIILLAHIFDGVYANLMVGVYLKKLTSRLPLVTGLAALFTILANLAFVPYYGMMAAAWITLAAFAIEAGMLWVVVRKAYPIPYEWGRILRLSLGCGVILAAGFVPALSVWWCRAILLLLFPFVLYVAGFPDAREKSYVKRLLAGG